MPVLLVGTSALTLSARAKKANEVKWEQRFNRCGVIELVEVIVQPNESIDSALKRFNQKVQQAGVLRRLKEKAFYEKPSEIRRRRKRRPSR